MASNALKELNPAMFGGAPRDDRPVTARVKEWLEQADENCEFSSRSIANALGDSVGPISGALTTAREAGWVTVTRKEGLLFIYQIADRSKEWNVGEVKPAKGQGKGAGGVSQFLQVPMTERLEKPDAPAERPPVDICEIGMQMLELVAKLDGYRPPRGNLEDFTSEELMAELARRLK